MIRDIFIKFFMTKEHHSQLNSFIINCIKKNKKDIYKIYLFFYSFFFIHKLTLIVNLSKRPIKGVLYWVRG